MTVATAAAVDPDTDPDTGQSKSLDLPIIVAGQRVTDMSQAYSFEYDTGYTVRLPRLDPESVERFVSVSNADLVALSIDQIVHFFDKVGKAWMDPANPWRRLAIEWGSRATGYATPTIEWDVNMLGTTLAKAKQYDFIEVDLDNPALLDEWAPHKAVMRRCWPKGRVLHVMVGNAPVAALFTLYRSLVTKNATVAKLPKRDVVTSLCFANCVYDVDPTHPVTRAMSVGYWDPEADRAVEDRAIEAADVICVWGRAAAVESVKSRAPHGVDVIEFGPKRSFALVTDGVEDWDRLGMRLAYDCAVYDQEGCFSLQEVLVQGDPQPLVESLSRWLGTYGEAIPRRMLTPDAAAHIQRARMDALADGWQVRESEGSSDWTIVVTDGPRRIDDHPLCRFVYIHPIENLSDALPLMDRNLQTVGVEPWPPTPEVADLLTGGGADRLVQPGRMTRFRPGFIHDGFHPLRRMVRWSTIERGLEYGYRFMSRSAQEDEDLIYRQHVRIPH